MYARARDWFAERPDLRDTAVAGLWAVLGSGLLALGIAPLWGGIAIFAAPKWLFLITLLGTSAAVTLRSRHPVLALAFGAVFALVDALGGGSLGTILALTDLVYACVKYGSDRAVANTARVALCGAIVTTVLLVLVRPGDPGIIVACAQYALILLVSGLWGWNVRSEGARTRAALTEEHRRETALLRDRIAHDLHDLVANSVAVAGLHIEAAKLHATAERPDPELLESSLEQAKLGTDTAHRELRTLISVLTAVDALDLPAPLVISAELDGLSGLLPGTRRLVWEGETRETLSAGLAEIGEPGTRVVLRALGELLANAAKHGTGDALILADLMDGELRITVSNPCRAQSLQAHRTGTGIGIEGARLLLHGIGGELESRGSRSEWHAAIRVPVGAARSATVPAGRASAGEGQG